MDQKLMERLRRLQEMVRGATNENEAMIAARRLHSLMAKNGITEADLGPEDEVDQESYEVSAKTGGGTWSKVIGCAIAELYFCKGYVMRGRGTGHFVYIVGQKRHRDTARIVASSVTRAIDAEARATSKTHRPQHTDGWAWITSFRNAAATRVSQRCAQMIEAGRRGELADSEGEGNLPVLASMYDAAHLECNNWMNANLNLTQAKLKTKNTSLAAHEAGTKFGNSVALGNEIGHHAPKLLG